MKALSIRQPWAWLIVHGFKDIENRKWRTRERGRRLIHAGKAISLDDYHDAVDVCERVAAATGDDSAFRALPALQWFKDNACGGIVGAVEIADCVDRSPPSLWFFGPFGFVLKNPTALAAMIPCKGALGFFVPEIAGMGVDLGVKAGEGTIVPPAQASLI